MRFFHLSDLHIGLKLINRDLGEDQRHVLSQVIDYAKEKKPDAIVIAGDIYDKAIPAAEAVELFDSFTAMLTEELPGTAIMMISGNHDSASRVNVFRTQLSKQKFYMIGQPPRKEDEFIEKVTLEDEYGPVNFYLLPFVKPSMVKQIVGTDEKGNNLSYDASVHKLIERENVDQAVRNVLVSHQFYLPVGKKADDIERMESEIKSVGNVDEVKADVLEVFDYAALGHIHKPMHVGSDKFRYCGTPMACSVSEAGQEKGVLMVDLGPKGQVSIETLKLTPLHQVRVIKGEYKEVLKQGCDDYVTVVLTDQVDLDVFDMQDRIRNAFPNLLNLERENARKANYSKEALNNREMNPYELCCSFLKDATEDQMALLQDVINTVMEVKS